MRKTAIIYGQMKNDIQKRAVEELSKILLDYTLEYPVCVQYGDDINTEDLCLIYIGTKENNGYIMNNSKADVVLPEAYSIEVYDNTVIIEGFDDAGVLYGVLDLYNRYIVKFEHPDNDKYWVNIWEMDKLPPFKYTSAPSVKERGLWTWGHVIYDYRDYLHNMMKLKMNSVIIWNDFMPTNARDIVDYAHSCNIKLYWGFSWLWDTNFEGLSIGELSFRESEKIFQKYENEYAEIGGDGIYFQTFTEYDRDNLGGVIIADAATKFVNRTAELFYKKYPNLEILFGLHARSVKNRLSFIREVDPRIRIVWEDCGAFPFSYIPTDIEDFENTTEFVRNISCLRGDDDRFGVVTKGLVKLDWCQFKHLKGPQCIGVSSTLMKKNRVERKSRIWRYIQAGWLSNADKAQQMVQEMHRLKSRELSVFALVEDGMFEENIMYPVALYSEILWNCEEDIKEIIKNVALRSYVCFA